MFYLPSIFTYKRLYNFIWKARSHTGRVNNTTASYAGLWILILKLPGFPFADDVTGVGLITKNKVISSEGAGQGKCNEEIEKKLITITISLLLIRIFLVIIFSRMFCQQNIKVSGCFRCFAVPVFWFWSIHILFDSFKFEHEGEIFMYNDRV